MNKGFMKKIKDLQKKHEGKIVLVRIGIFFCGIGKDAVILNKLINYKPICMKEGICKIGIPVNCFVKGEEVLIQGYLNKNLEVIAEIINY